MLVVVRLAMNRPVAVVQFTPEAHTLGICELAAGAAGAGFLKADTGIPRFQPGLFARRDPAVRLAPLDARALVMQAGIDATSMVRVVRLRRCRQGKSAQQQCGSKTLRKNRFHGYFTFLIFWMLPQPDVGVGLGKDLV